MKGKFDVNLCNEIPEGWDELIDRSVGGSIYQKSIWLNTHQEIAGGQLRCMTVQNRGGKLLAGQYFRRVRGSFGFDDYTQFPLSAYSGVFFSNRDVQNTYKQTTYYQEICAALISTYKSIGRGRFRAILSPKIIDARPFMQGGFKASLHYTYLLSIENLDNAYARLALNVRTNLKKTLELREDEFDLPAMYLLYSKVFTRQGKEAPVNRQYFIDLIGILSKSGNAKIFTAHADGKIIGFRVCLWDETDTIHDWLAASDPMYNHLSPNVNLLWKIVEFGFKNGKHYFDLNGADVPQVANFKAQFGGYLKPYYEVTGYTSIVKRQMDATRMFFGA